MRLCCYTEGSFNCSFEPQIWILRAGAERKLPEMFIWFYILSIIVKTVALYDFFLRSAVVWVRLVRIYLIAQLFHTCIFHSDSEQSSKHIWMHKNPNKNQGDAVKCMNHWAFLHHSIHINAPRSAFLPTLILDSVNPCKIALHANNLLIKRTFRLREAYEYVLVAWRL